MTGEVETLFKWSLTETDTLCPEISSLCCCGCCCGLKVVPVVTRKVFDSESTPEGTCLEEELLPEDDVVGLPLLTEAFGPLFARIIFLLKLRI